MDASLCLVMNRGRATLMGSTLILSSAVSVAHESSETAFTYILYIHACTRNNPSALLLSVVWTCTEAFSHRNDTVQSCAYGDVRKKTDGGNRCSFFCPFLCVDETTFDSQSDSCFQRRHLLFLKFKNTENANCTYF